LLPRAVSIYAVCHPEPWRSTRDIAILTARRSTRDIAILTARQSTRDIAILNRGKATRDIAILNRGKATRDIVILNRGEATVKDPTTASLTNAVEKPQERAMMQNAVS
jgi:hypothetical protein